VSLGDFWHDNDPQWNFGLLPVLTSLIHGIRPSAMPENLNKKETETYTYTKLQASAFRPTLVAASGVD